MATSTTGRRIARRRAELGISLSELARCASVSKSHLHSIEHDSIRNPSTATLTRIAVALGTTADDLLGKEIHLADALPDGLAEFAQGEELIASDIAVLSGIEYRGQRPRTVESWRYLHEAIKRSVQRDNRQSVT